MRGWCESLNDLTNSRKFFFNQKDSWSAPKVKLKWPEGHERRPSKKDSKTVLWFEVEDTGCGINSKL